MVTNIVMPRLSLTMKEGTIGKWYKREGERVEKGEPIVEIVSEKATYDLETPASGILRKIIAEAGVDTQVNAVIGVIGTAEELLPQTESSEATAGKSDLQSEEPLLASPAAKRLAREHDVDLSSVAGSGPEGRVSEDDVKLFLEQKAETSPRVKQTLRLSGLRKISAERVSASFRTAPHSTLFMEVELRLAKDLHEKTQVSYTAMVVKAAANALSESPSMNSTLEGDQIRIFEDLNVGVATATENGLIVPIIHNADRKSLKEIDALIRGLADKARQGKLLKEELSGGTFTITNLGMYGVDFFSPIINPPEAAILGVGRIVEKPVVVNERVEPRPMITLSLSYDHRIVDGAPAGTFLQRIKEKIEKLTDLT